MPRKISPAILLMLALLAGCGRKAVSIDNPSAFAAGDYDKVFNAAVEELRDRRFIVARQDRRFGAVTTRPLIASSVAEPWYSDNTSGRQVAESTLNLDRRTVRVSLAPADPIAVDTHEPPSRYLLSVEVAMDRRQHAPRQLTTSAFGLPSLSRRRHDRTLVTERGLEEGYWKPLGRDPLLEQRLIDAILGRAAGSEVRGQRSEVSDPIPINDTDAE